MLALTRWLREEYFSTAAEKLPGFDRDIAEAGTAPAADPCERILRYDAAAKEPGDLLYKYESLSVPFTLFALAGAAIGVAGLCALAFPVVGMGAGLFAGAWYLAGNVAADAREQLEKRVNVCKDAEKNIAATAGYNDLAASPRLDAAMKACPALARRFRDAAKRGAFSALNPPAPNARPFSASL